MEKFIVFYKKYKEIIIPGVFLIGAIFIVFQITMPNFYSINELNQEIAVEQKKLNTFQNSYGVITALDENILNEKAKAAIQALPATKDPGNIYLAVVSAASEADVQLKNFSVNVGSILTNGEAVENTPIPVTVTANFSGMDVASFQSLIAALMKETPISNIKQASITNNDGSIVFDFYFKSYDLSKINSESISNLSADDEQTLKAITF